MKKLRFLQRGTALCLVLALLLGMAPELAAPKPASAAGEGDSIEYSFLTGAYDGDTDAVNMRTLTT